MMLPTASTSTSRRWRSPQDSNNLAAEHGPSNFDTRQRFTAAFTYQLPRFGGPKRLSDGWQVNTIITLQSGRPVPVVNSDDTSGAEFDQFPSPSNFHQRPNLVPGQAIMNSNWASGPDTIGYLNGNAFADPPLGTFGTLGRNAIYGPHFRNVDFAVTKITPITDRVSLQLRAEFFNIFNHPNFALPNFFVSPGTPNQGLITQTPDQAQTNPGLGGRRAAGDSGGSEVFVLRLLRTRVVARFTSVALAAAGLRPARDSRGGCLHMIVVTHRGLSLCAVGLRAAGLRKSS